MTELTIPRYAPIWPTILKFNGTSDYVEIPNNEDIDFDKDSEFTLAFWMLAEMEQPNNVENEAIEYNILEKWSSVDKYSYAVSYLWRLEENEQLQQQWVGRVKVDLYLGKLLIKEITSEMSIDIDTYYYIAVVISNNEISLYINGNQDGAKGKKLPSNIPQALPNSDSLYPDSLYLGRGEYEGNFFNGCIGRLQIFKSALGKQQILYWLERSTSILPFQSPEDDLIGDWRCNEGYGAIAFDYVNNNNGVLGGSDGLQAQPEWVASGIPTGYINLIKSSYESQFESPSESQSSSNLLAKFFVK
ncbi:LamG domain-containing protein [Okeania sp. SIO2B3]|uniref:LamG domain-containing protein n=1 Tax=Okeania sp. SIO2B3 TaxID=2607784 RepID=UPI0013C21C1A|nr:LamG domain-containing protein [Okeania sp. SIO2B3]NET46281.1 LamG domain-containing protein [Okeania sp. SIO2B3]